MNVSKLEEIENALNDLSREEQLLLIEHIAERLRQSEGKQAQPLYGAWQGKFPVDVDIDKDLVEVRRDWMKKFEKLAP
ncbi:MAG: hypothetical protein HYR55_00975 [Acidobacteria bacterium]|nr:hypothetical protein [Acidobacteriota bacterium]